MTDQNLDEFLNWMVISQLFITFRPAILANNDCPKALQSKRTEFNAGHTKKGKTRAHNVRIAHRNYFHTYVSLFVHQHLEQRTIGPFAPLMKREAWMELFLVENAAMLRDSDALFDFSHLPLATWNPTPSDLPASASLRWKISCRVSRMQDTYKTHPPR